MISALILILVASTVAVCATRSTPNRYPISPGNDCHLESGHDYPSLWNKTSLLVCAPGRPERVCVVGGGASGVHAAWLLRRRGFNRTTLFEANPARLGGKIWTRAAPATPPSRDDVTRELGAAFLSPDYDEVRGLLKRFGQHEVPLSVKHAIRFHHTAQNGTEIIERAADWSNAWVSEFTGTANASANAGQVGAALARYEALHASIFGRYAGRFPPKPATPAKMATINGTMLDFLARNDLEVLTPFMYQFFVLQGMGLLGTMPAYYCLKWASPASLRAGGFGNDKDTPLAMLRDGYGAVVDALARDAGLDVRLGARVVAVERPGAGGSTGGGGGGGGGGAATLRFADPAAHPDEQCDLVVLSGPIPRFVRGSDDGSVAPILTPATAAEADHFAGQHAMQFLISLLELGKDPEAAWDEFEALEYFPDNFPTLGGVIVRRDIGYAEDGPSENANRIGGLQSFSFWGAPNCTRGAHWASQQAWLRAHDLTAQRVLGQAWFDTYYYHYGRDADVMAGKPWALGSLQLLDATRTLYVGGAAAYETVEDSFVYNLQLMHDFIDVHNTDSDDHYDEAADATSNIDNPIRVLVFGDSWGSDGPSWKAVRDMFARNNVSADVQSSAVGGTRACQWASHPKSLAEEAAAKFNGTAPDFVWYTLGGNDLMGSHYRKCSAAAKTKEEALGCLQKQTDSITACTDTLLSHFWAKYPRARVMQCGYDLPCEQGRCVPAPRNPFCGSNVTCLGESGLAWQPMLLTPLAQKYPHNYTGINIMGTVQMAGGVVGASTGHPVLTQGSPCGLMTACVHPRYGKAGAKAVGTAFWDLYFKDATRELLAARRAAGQPRAQAPVPSAPAVAVATPQPALELLRLSVPCASLPRFVAADNGTWTAFLATLPSFRGKLVLSDPAANCTAWSVIRWASRSAWKAIPPAALVATQAAFANAFGSEPPLRPFPTANGDGLDVLLAVTKGECDSLGAIELNRVDGVRCDGIDAFVAADRATWTAFLEPQPGFVEKLTLALPTSVVAGKRVGNSGGRSADGTCSVWTFVRWASRADWAAVEAQGKACGRTAAAFTKALGYPTTLHRLPSAKGLDVLATESAHALPAPPGARVPARGVAINGNDVVAARALPVGARDVQGSPLHARYVNASEALPPALLHLHPHPYEFWFASEANADAFAADPWRYVPAFGGHCTHGIATRNDLTPALVVTGDVAFTCVNTTQWRVIGGALYMNSCGMFSGFEKDPAADIAAAGKLWARWFGGDRGPINDACFQDGGRFVPTNPVSALIPPHCVVNR